MGEPYELSDFDDRHPSTKGVLKFFTWEHLPEYLQKISEPFCRLALLEAKDAAVRAALIED